MPTMHAYLEPQAHRGTSGCGRKEIRTAVLERLSVLVYYEAASVMAEAANLPLITYSLLLTAYSLPPLPC